MHFRFLLSGHPDKTGTVTELTSQRSWVKTKPNDRLSSSVLLWMAVYWQLKAFKGWWIGTSLALPTGSLQLYSPPAQLGEEILRASPLALPPPQPQQLIQRSLYTLGSMKPQQHLPVVNRWVFFKSHEIGGWGVSSDAPAIDCPRDLEKPSCRRTGDFKISTGLLFFCLFSVVHYDSLYINYFCAHYESHIFYSYHWNKLRHVGRRRKQEKRQENN